LLAWAQGLGALATGEVSLMLAFRDRYCVPAFHVDVKVIFVGIGVVGARSVLVMVALVVIVGFRRSRASWCSVAVRLADALFSLVVRCDRLSSARY
jgi:hypothetical protein